MPDGPGSLAFDRRGKFGFATALPVRTHGSGKLMKTLTELPAFERINLVAIPFLISDYRRFKAGERF
jgi:hypothetical protein